MSQERSAVKERDWAFPLAARALVQARRLRTRTGLLGQGARYAIAGAGVTVFYLLMTSFLALVIGLPFEVALAIGFALSLTVHFTLQRTFVWADRERYALSLNNQAGRYLIASGVQYGLTAAGTALLPRLLGVSAEAAYLGLVPLLSLSNFLVFRYIVFHGAKVPAGPPL